MADSLKKIRTNKQYLKAYATRNLMAHIESNYGRATLMEVFGLMPPQYQFLFDTPPLPSMKIRYDVYHHLNDAVVQAVFDGDSTKAFVLSRKTTKETIGQIFTFVLGLTSPKLVIQMTTKIWGFYSDVGTMEVEFSGPNQLTLTHRNTLVPTLNAGYDLAGACIAYLEATGSSGDQLSDVRIDGNNIICQFELAP